MQEVSPLLNLTAYERYNTLFNSLKQLPPVEAPGYANLAGAFMTAKYGSAMNTALSSSLSSTMKTFRDDASSLAKQAGSLTDKAAQSALGTADGAVTGVTASKDKNATISVEQLATRQVNQSTLAPSGKATTLGAGNHTLSLQSGENTYSFSINVRNGESNGSVLSKTAEGINSLNAGVTARVASDSLGNKQLVVESSATGTNSAFSFSGDASQELGLNQVTQTAENAAYSYNGKAYESQSNTVSADSGKTTLELKKVTDGTAALNRSTDTSGLKDSIKALAESYNQLQSTLKAAPDNKAMQAISRQLNQLVGNRAGDLAKFGVTRNAQGEMKIDENRLDSQIAANPSGARSLFVDRNSLSDRLQSKSNQLLNLPAASLVDQGLPQSATPYQLSGGNLVSRMMGTQTTGNIFDLFL